MKPVLIVALALATSLAAACLNDRDTLAAEVARKPDVLWVIVGRFERNPPLYYQMRIDRVSKELQAQPGRIDLYDDISVAYDRIHRDDLALQWISKKLPLLKQHGSKMDWYRYYANAGTFHAHHWFATTSKDASELKTAEQMIEKAIEINSDAHFGREGYQLAAIEWALGNLETEDPVPFADSADLTEAMKNDLKGRGVDGLAGLIRLGGAWESPDIFDALGIALRKQYRTQLLSQQAFLRRDELVQSGRKPLGPMSSNEPVASGTDAARYAEEFQRLRKDADEWQQARTDFMMARLKQGRHPDTDPHFWDGYVERPKPDVWSPPFWATMDWVNRVIFPGLCFGLPTLLTAILVWKVARMLRDNRAV